MNKLTQDSTTEFLERFCSFYDSVFRSIQIEFNPNSISAKTTIAVRDTKGLTKESKQKNEGWVSVVLHLEGVSEFNFHDRSTFTFVVLSDGLHIIWLGDEIGIDFSCLPDIPTTIEELRESKAYVLAKSVTWSVEEYY